MDEKSKDISLLAVGLEDATKKIIGDVIDLESVYFIDTREQFEKFLDEYAIDSGMTIIAGSAKPDLGADELGQSLRGNYIKAKITYVTYKSEEFNLKRLIKNGFDNAFMLPMDNSFLEQAVSSAPHVSLKKRYTAVKLVDIQEDQDLNFNIYAFMPHLKKHILINAAGTLSKKKTEMLKEKSQSKVYIETQQMEKFNTYNAVRLVQLHGEGTSTLSETDKEKRLKENIRQLFHNVLDQQTESSFDTGRELMEQVHQIVHKFVETKTKIDLKSQISNLLEADCDSYDHVQTVASLACLLSLALKVGQPEDLAIAGLFHDIGISGFVVNPNPFTMNQLSQADLERYQSHPTVATFLLKNKKVSLSPSIAEIIEKHHERVDGKGFPNRLPEHKIPQTAQLLSFCDLFEYLMKEQKEKGEPFRVMEAVDKIKKLGYHSNDLLEKIRNFFLELNLKK